MTAIKEQLTNSAARWSKRAGSVADEMQNRAESAWQGVRQRATLVLRAPVACVREYPVSTTLVALGLGLLLALFVGRRAPVFIRKRSVREQLHRSRGMLLGLLPAVVSGLRRAVSLAFRLTGSLICKGRGLHQPGSIFGAVR